MSYTSKCPIATSKERIYLQSVKDQWMQSWIEGGGHGGPRTGEQNSYSAPTQSHPEAAASKEWDITGQDTWKAEFVKARCEASYRQGKFQCP